MSYKKWIHKYKFLQEDLSDTEEQLKEYTKKFNEIFEDNYNEEKIKQEAINKEKLENPKKEEEIIKENKPGKKLYKKLSKIYHPDRETGNEDKFKLISILYKSGDTVGLILEAIDVNIKIENYLDQELINSFKNSCNQLETQIKLKKNTLAWHWSTAPEGAKDQLKKFLLLNHPIKERKK